MPSKPRIIIVGASIAGLTVANGLMQTNLCEVAVFERFSESESGRLPRNGGGVGLHEESVRILNSLGVSTNFILPMRIQEDRDRTGRIIRKETIPFYSAFWGDVHRCLLKSALAAGAIVHYDKNVISIMETDVGISLGFSDGTVSPEGICVIGADGILSSVRSLMFSEKLNSKSDLVRHAGYYAWRGLVPLEDLPAGTEDIFRKEVFVIEISEKSHAILYYLPRGLNWLIYFNSDSEATPTYHQSREIIGQITSAASEAELEEFHRMVESLYQPALVKVIEASKTPLPFKNQIYDRSCLSSYSTGRCVLVGDAAHASTPHYIRGTNMAIEDGYVLAKEFAQALSSDFDPKSSASLKKIFCGLEKQRLGHCNGIVQVSARIGRVRQGVFSERQGPSWDTTCNDFELCEMLGDS